MNAPARKSLPVIQGDVIEQLSYGKLPELERELVTLARAGELKGVVKKKPRFSATTIENHAQCARKYYWPTISGLEEPPSGAQVFGTKLHKHEERWLKDGTPPPAHDEPGRLANLGLSLLPQPKAQGLHVEMDFAVRLPGVPVEVTGQIDFTRDPAKRGDTSFLLGDHKTARSRYYWAMEKGGDKGKAWLRGNIQSNLYSYIRALQLREAGFKSLKVVDKQWIYYFKEDRAAEKLRVVQDLSEVAEQYETVIKPNILSMAAMVEEAPKISDIPRADESVCDMYGGCKHRARCFGMGAGSGLMGSASRNFSRVSVFENRRPQDGTTKEEESMGVLAGKFGKGAVQAAAKVQGAGATINPPKPAPLKVAAKVEVDLPVEIDDGAPPIEETEAVVKKGRKTIAKAAEQLDKAFEKPAAKSKDLRTPGSNPEHSFWLFIGCAPEKGFSVEPTLVDVLVGTAQANLVAQNDGAHYRRGMPYAALEASMADWMEENAVTGAVLVREFSPAARDVIGLLRAHADVVVSGGA